MKLNDVLNIVRRPITPLLFFCRILLLCDGMAVLGAIMTSGHVQMIFTVTAAGCIVITLCIVSAIVWKKPFNLHSPSDFGKNVNVIEYAKALQLLEKTAIEVETLKGVQKQLEKSVTNVEQIRSELQKEVTNIAEVRGPKGKTLIIREEKRIIKSDSKDKG